MKSSYEVAVLAGDGVGPEVTAQALRVLQEAARLGGWEVRLHHGLLGGAAIDAAGQPFPEETRSLVLRCDAVLMGAVGGPKWDSLPGPLRPESGLLAVRQALGVYANLRPVRLLPVLAACSPLRAETVAQGIDMLIIRELTGGLYYGQPKERRGDAAVDTMAYSTAEVARLARVGFEAARARRRHVTSIDKANVLETSRLWRQVVTEVAAGYPDVALEHGLVDSAAMQLVLRPSRYDVIITENTFGDILSDLGAVLAGSIGLLPSASLGEPGGVGLYEPIHGTAPDIAGEGVVNPVGAILSVAMMVRYTFGREDEARRIEGAVEQVLTSGQRTADVMTPGATRIGTAAMGDRVLAAMGAREGSGR